MQELILSLEKRRKLAASAVVFISIVLLIISMNHTMQAVDYFNPKYNMYGVYSLLVYKVLELLILYYLLFYRYLSQLHKFDEEAAFSKKMSKHTKLLFFLIPQGNIIFGLISYKLSGEVQCFLLFALIALIALAYIRPKALNKCSEYSQP